jgi:hypothetical protein
MKLSSVAPLAFWACRAFAASMIEGGHTNRRCNILVSITDYENDETDEWRAECEISGQFHALSWSQSFVRNLLDTNQLISGVSELDLVGAELKNGIIYLPENTESIFGAINHYDSSSEMLDTGTKRLLVVRIIARDSVTSMSSDQISDKVFGTSGDPANVKSQYSSCSFKQFNFVPAVNQGVVNGVLEITISENATNAHSGDILNAVTKAMGGKPMYADYVMYTMPPGTKGGWLAYAYINSWISVYNDKWIKSLSANMHEIGHNLGLGHSNENGVSYGDQSGYMGYSYKDDDSPLMCFNAYQSWQLGWYRNKTKLLQSRESFTGALSAIVDFDKKKSDTVLIRINTSKSMDYYINYNKKTSFNAGTLEGSNQVLVVTAIGNGSIYSETNLVAKLNSGGSFTFETDTGSNMTLMVNSIDVNGTANIHIGPLCLPNSQCQCHPCNPSKSPIGFEFPVPTESPIRTRDKDKYKNNPGKMRCRGC